MGRVCANCGTEVDEDALFCPTCGQPIEAGLQPQLPPAPDWPEPPPQATAQGPDAPAGTEPAENPIAEPTPRAVVFGQPAQVEPSRPSEGPATELAAGAEPPERPAPAEPVGTPESSVPPWRRGVKARPAPIPPAVHPEDTAPLPSASAPAPAWRSSQPAAQHAPPAPTESRALFRPDPTVTLPETLSGWLAGAGALIGVLVMLLPWRAGGAYTSAWGFASGINVLVGILLLAVLGAILLPHLLPRAPRRDLAIAGVGLLGVGIGLDRLGLPLTGLGATVFLIAMLAVAAGGLLAELGLDRRTGGPQR